MTSRRTASEGRWEHKPDWGGLRVRRWGDRGSRGEGSPSRSTDRDEKNGAPVGGKAEVKTGLLASLLLKTEEISIY